MKTKVEDEREVDTRQEEEQLVEWGDASQETRGGWWGFFPEGGGKSYSG